MQPKGQARKTCFAERFGEGKELEMQGCAQAKDERGDMKEMKDQPWHSLSKHVLAGTLCVSYA